MKNREHAIDFLDTLDYPKGIISSVVRKTPLATLLTSFSRYVNTSNVRCLTGSARCVTSGLHVTTNPAPHDNFPNFMTPGNDNDSGITYIFYPNDNTRNTMRQITLAESTLQEIKQRLSRLSQAETKKLYKSLFALGEGLYRSGDFRKSHDSYYACIYLLLLTQETNTPQQKEKLLQLYCKIYTCETKQGRKTGEPMRIISGILMGTRSFEDAQFFIEESKLFKWFLKKSNQSAIDIFGDVLSMRPNLQRQAPISSATTAAASTPSAAAEETNELKDDDNNTGCIIN